jgi:hypothetical protein
MIGLIPSSVTTYHDILVLQHERAQDGYTALYQILSTCLPKLQDFHPKWGPDLTKKINMFKYVNQMQAHMDLEASYGRSYTDFEIVINIIQHAVQDPRYEIAVRTAKALLQNIMSQAPGQHPTLPPDLTLQRLAQTLEPSRGRRNLTQAFDGNTPTLHKFESKRPMDPKN